MKNIYIILFHKFSPGNEYFTETRDLYFTSKSEAIKYLEYACYTHKEDDIYRYRFDFTSTAEIIGLVKWEDYIGEKTTD